MLDPILEKIFEKLKDAKLAPAYLEQINLLQQHVDFLSDKLALTEKELAKKESKLETAENELAGLRTQITSFEGKAKDIEIGPCFIKETHSGKRLKGIYCPHCRSIMEKGQYTAYSDTISYRCTHCKYEVSTEAIDTALADFYS